MDLGFRYQDNVARHLARRSFQKAVDLDPEYALGYFCLAQMTDDAVKRYALVEKGKQYLSNANKGEKAIIAPMVKDSWWGGEGGVDWRKAVESFTKQFPKETRYWNFMGNFARFDGDTAKALFYFALGLPAFSLIKVFSSFFFARHNTKLPFYISLFSVLLNIIISVIFFKKIGFIIIPIATTISSWFNSILLFIFLKKENLFKFNLIFFSRFIRIIFSVIIMGFFFNYLIIYFASNLAFEQSYKSAYLVALALIGLISYLLIAVLIKAFKISDINLKY